MDFFKAVKQGETAAVSAWLQGGGDPDVQDHNGMTGLMLAVDNGHQDILVMLVKAKAKLNLTALGFAMDNGNVEAAALLRKAGAK